MIALKIDRLQLLLLLLLLSNGSYSSRVIMMMLQRFIDRAQFYLYLYILLVIVFNSVSLLLYELFV